ncbi:TPA: hydroxyacylglutathione hydrolase [Legionella pneumophila]|nr:hydroxyacylglutathione hydrolase [Legionella pneumophila]HAT2047943.1 hydroxyacylglutathione hydrolase [Legionella pneumophila]HAT4007841.1 hydroxyacylglutathione hydrolase [Legionella pneumophila]HAT6364120.1 hydroxyacylglutathione hydrolase [Legionella pneumophila]HAT6365728.1 hydroxyacylglutathione hydrolase [Legionella pneumophila]HAT6369476.1 hydroxyacylglutathione hydrolase [Legionella pneumophila]
MTVLPISAFSDNYIWVFIDKIAGAFDCVDPGEAAQIIRFAQSNQLTLRTILLTHHHYDHTGGVDSLVKQWPSCKVYGPMDERINHITKPVKQGQSVQIGCLNFHVLFNPGHTSTHISYYEPEQGWLFCGDTLFSAGCGRVFDGTIEELHESLLLFKKLPRDTKVFCAHEYTLQNLRFAHTVEPCNSSVIDYMQQIMKQSSPCTLPSTIDLELSINPFLRTDEEQVKQYALSHGARSSDSLDVFKVLRNQKNLFE